jgi:hypothetical protein
MSLGSRLFALFSAALVVYAGVAPGLERCSVHGNPTGDSPMSGMAMSHAGMPSQTGQGSAGWTTPGHPASSAATNCSVMTSCSSQCYVGTTPVIVGTGSDRLAVAMPSTPVLMSLVTAPESPPPKL